MCIIVAKKSGVKMPDTETLKTCFANNPDGAGFMFASGKEVHGIKGMMTFEEFQTELLGVEKKYGSLTKLPIVMHFRIATHGGVSQGNTHPFPIGTGYREMRKTEWSAAKGLAHNGIINLVSCDKDITKYKVSDTMVFIKKFVNPITKYAPLKDNEILNLLHEIADSKLCFLDREGNILTRGDFVEEKDVLYSNSSYKEKKTRSARGYDSYYENGHGSYLRDNYGWYWSEQYDTDDITTKLTQKEIEDLAYKEDLTPLSKNMYIETFDGYAETLKAGEAWISEGLDIYVYDPAFQTFELYITREEIFVITEEVE